MLTAMRLSAFSFIALFMFPHLVFAQEAAPQNAVQQPAVVQSSTQTTENAPANQVVPNLVEVLKPNIANSPVSANPSLCNEIASQIVVMSSATSSSEVNPWESLDWLQQNLGQSHGVQVGGFTGYAWVCQKSNNPATLTAVVYFSFDLMGVTRKAIGNLVCVADSPCAAYGFERNGDQIFGRQIKSPQIQ